MQLYIKCYIVTKHNFQFTHPLQGCGAVSEAGSPVCGRANTHFCGTNCVSKYLDTHSTRGAAEPSWWALPLTALSPHL